MQEEFAKRVGGAGAELNARLGPLFKQQRRRKRKVIVWLVVGSAFAALVWPGHAALGPGAATS